MSDQHNQHPTTLDPTNHDATSHDATSHGRHRPARRGPVAAAARWWGPGRQHRRALAAAGTLSVVGVAVLGLLIASGQLTFGTGKQPLAGVATEVSNELLPDNRPADDIARVKATPEAMLELLTQLVPTGKTSKQAKSSDGRLHVQMYLDDGRGPGMIRLWVGTTAPTGAAPQPTCKPGGDPERICRTLPNGAQVTIVNVPDNCVQRTAVTVDHANGTNVGVDIASCLEFDGTINPAGRLALTADQAVAIAADSRWGETMDPALVTAGQKRFPTLPATSLPEPARRGSGAAAGSSNAGYRPPATGVAWEDFNGDDTADYCRRVGEESGGRGRVACTLTVSTGFGQTATSPVMDVGPEQGRGWADFNGDNNADYCRRVGAANGPNGRVACTLSTGTGFGATITSNELDLGQEAATAWDDVNGDGKADYCRRAGSRNGFNGRIACTVSTGTGFGETITSGDVDLGQDAGWEWEDVNGDEKSDYCRRLSPKSGVNGRVACTLSTGNGFGQTVTSAEIDLGQDVGAAWEDVNGDDKSDYCRRLSDRNGSMGKVACTLSTGTGFGESLTSGELDLGHDAGAAWEDINGDDHADYCRRVGRQSGVDGALSCTLSTGTGFGGSISSPVIDWGQDIGAVWVDVNGDEKNDYCRRVGAENRVNSALSCTLSTGTGFNATTKSPVLDWGQDD